MKVTLDRTLCNGYGNCVMEAPEVFDLDDEALGIVLQDEPPAEQLERTEAAARTCPVQAISLAS